VWIRWLRPDAAVALVLVRSPVAILVAYAATRNHRHSPLGWMGEAGAPAETAREVAPREKTHGALVCDAYETTCQARGRSGQMAATDNRAASDADHCEQIQRTDHSRAGGEAKSHLPRSPTTPATCRL
jgi:hypothetical protein